MFSPVATTKIDTSSWLGTSVSLRGIRGADELELELLPLAPWLSFSARWAPTSAPASANGIISFDASARGELLLFACPFSFEGGKKPLRIVFEGSERGQRERECWEDGERKEDNVFCFVFKVDSSNVDRKSESKRRAKFFSPLSTSTPLFLSSLFPLSLSLQTQRTRAPALLRKTEQIHTQRFLSVALSGKTHKHIKSRKVRKKTLSKTSLRRSGFSFEVSP